MSDSPSLKLAQNKSKNTNGKRSKVKMVEQTELEQAKQTAKDKKKDLIELTVKELENLDKESAYEQVSNLSENIDYNYFRLGGVFSVIQANGWYHDDGYENFRQCVEDKFGVQYRKAMYLIQIYNDLVASGVKWSQVKSIGWSKLKAL